VPESWSARGIGEMLQKDAAEIAARDNPMP
jgi:hypothetical protein